MILLATYPMVLMVFILKIMVWWTNAMITYPLKLSKLVKKLSVVSTNLNLREYTNEVFNS